MTMTHPWNDNCVVFPSKSSKLNHAKNLGHVESCPFCHIANPFYKGKAPPVPSRDSHVVYEISDEDSPRKQFGSAQIERMLPKRTAPPAVYHSTRPPPKAMLRHERIKGKEAQFSMLNKAATERARQKAVRREYNYEPESQRKDGFLQVQFATVLKYEYWEVGRGANNRQRTQISMPPVKVGKSVSLAINQMYY